jgi:hypothetical protein
MSEHELRARVRAIFAAHGARFRQYPEGATLLDLRSEENALIIVNKIAQIFLREENDSTSPPATVSHLRLVQPQQETANVDPTQALIDLMTALDELEAAFEDDPKSEAVELLRTEAIGHLNALSNWLGPLNGFPPKVSEIDFEDE